MTRWKGRSSRATINANLNSKESEDEDLDYTVADVDITALQNTSLLFPKESSGSTSPLFPTSRKKFMVMTCKRTVFACRGFFLFCLIVFLVISFVASNNSNSDSSSVNNRTSDSTKDPTLTLSENHQKFTLILPEGSPSVNNGSIPNALPQIVVNYNTECRYRKTDYAIIGNSLRKGLEFFERNFENITVLDGALGTKIVTEQLYQTIASHPMLPLEVQGYVGDLAKRAAVLTVKITETVKRASNSTEDLTHTLPWVDTKGLWDLPQDGIWYSAGKLKSYEPPKGFEDLWNMANRKEVIGETESDACIYQVFHCSSANITNSCRRDFLENVGTQYSLTHQVIYMLLARKMKCFDEKTWKNVEALQHKGDLFLEKLCGRVWQEANTIAEANFPPKFRDLFIEQIGMCSLAGYTDFLKREWLRRIISWQSMSSSGCFGLGQRRRGVPTIGQLVAHYQKNQNRPIPGGGFNEFLQSRHIVIRHKRSDMFLEDGNSDRCSVHFTSVGVTALSLYLRYFVDSCMDLY